MSVVVMYEDNAGTNGSGTAPALPGITDFSGVTGLAAGHPLLLKYLEAQFSDFYTYTGSGSASVTAPDDPQYMFDYFINTKPLNSIIGYAPSLKVSLNFLACLDSGSSPGVSRISPFGENNQP